MAGRMTTTRLTTAAQLMDGFAARTGLTSDAPPRRYLWTDAFAVCNCLGLHRRTGAARWLECAGALIEQVHHVLGRHRPDDARTGWISGLPEAEGARHPTIGGLRIGKPLPERGPADVPDEWLDWERDGQYYHYLTRWLHALERAAAATGNRELLRYGVELASTAERAFAHRAAGEGRLYWKLSIDLAQSVVATMGQHDPLDGLTATAALEALALAAGAGTLGPELRDLAAMCAGRGWATRDALGIGMLLTDALLLARLAGRVPAVSDELLVRALRDAARSLELVTTGRFLWGPAGDRLAFRELGLAIGLAAAERLEQLREAGALPGGAVAAEVVERLQRHVPLRAQLESFWLQPEHQVVDTWVEHEDINAVMLATSLLPDGYLE